VWQDGGKSRVRIGPFHPTRKVTVQRMEYRNGPATIYPIHRVRTGIVVDLSDQKYWFRDPSTEELISVTSVIQNAVGFHSRVRNLLFNLLISFFSWQDNDSWDLGGGGGRAKVRFAPGEDPIEC
jgi:hypothetical protein